LVCCSIFFAPFHSSLTHNTTLACPIFISPSDKCQNVTHDLKISALDPESGVDVTLLITQINSAIEEGRLQDILTNLVNSKSNVYIVTGMEESPANSTSLGPPAIIGIIFGVAASSILLITFMLLIKRKRDNELIVVPAAATQIHSSLDLPDIENDKSGQAEIGSASNIFHDTSSKEFAYGPIEIESNEETKEKDIVVASSSSSQAGSSGWFSSLGNSTVNSGSFDTEENVKGSSLVAISDVSSIVENQEGKDV
jgi:hypothetical protein